MIRALRLLRDRNDVVALVLIGVGVLLLPGAMPLGVWGLGVVGGAALALHVIGLVLVYRANRIINFAQVQIGAVAATFFVVMVNHTPFLTLVRAVCPPCIDQPSPALLRFNYYLSLVLALALSVVLALLVYLFVIKRFAQAPRLVVTVATIFVAQLLAVFHELVPNVLTTEDQRLEGLEMGATGPPFSLTAELPPQTLFHAPDLLTVAAAVVAVAGLGLYLRRSSTGVAIRAAAENPDRVGTLGVNADAVTSRVWIVAGALSGFAAVFNAMAVGAHGAVTLHVGTMVKILAIAVIARMTSLWVAAIGALVFGLAEQGVLWSFGTTAGLDAVLVVVVGAVLLLQRYRTTRADVEQATGWRADRQIRPIPVQLRSLPVVRRWVRNLAVAGVVAVLAFPWAMPPSETNLAAVFMLFAIIGLSLLVLTGWAGQISLGQFAFAAVGGYVTAVSGLPWPFALVLGALAGAGVAVIIGLPAIKLRGLHLAIMSLAFALSTTAVLVNPRYLGRYLPESLERPTLLGMSLDDQRVFYYFTLVVLAGTVAAVAGLRRSRTARALIAARDNEQAAQSFGINLVRARLGAFAISGGLASFAGGLYAFHQYGVTPSAFVPEQSVTMFLMAVIGGFGAIAGPLLGALYLFVLSLFSTDPLVVFLASGGGGLIILLLLPGGLAGFVFGIRDALLRRVAHRRRIVVPSLIADVRTEGMVAQRAPIVPKGRTRRDSPFVPVRYRLEDQWALGLTEDTTLHADAQARSHGAEDTGTRRDGFTGIHETEAEGADERR